MCGYHLRCLNQGESCPDCMHQHKDKNQNYLDDALGIRAKSAETMLNPEKGDSLYFLDAQAF